MVAGTNLSKTLIKHISCNCGFRFSDKDWEIDEYFKNCVLWRVLLNIQQLHVIKLYQQILVVKTNATYKMDYYIFHTFYYQPNCY